MTINSAVAKQICTKVELDLVLASTTRHIGYLSAPELHTKIKRARTYRDKWRDLAHDQTRDTKANNPNLLGDANERSALKAQLFDETLTRFEKRLEKVGKSPASARATAKSPLKDDRSREHRATRASVRDSLAAAKQELNEAAPSKKAAPKAAPKKDVAATATKKAKPSTTGEKQSKAPTKKATSAAKLPKAKPAKKKPTTASPLATDQAIAASPKRGMAGGASEILSSKRNLQASTAAKAAAVKRSGATKVNAHVASRNRRNQASRNKR
jgi:hypothetical protein